MGQLGMHDAATFHALHAPGELLILANVWDAGTARVVQASGAKALATSSAAVAWACGYADRGPLPPSILAGAVRSIARVISVPLSVDAENGYSDDPRQVAENVRALIDAGAVGINIEDRAEPPERLAAKIEAIRSAADAAGVRLFVNARCDVVLRSPDRPDLVEEILRRAAIYREAGADGLFAIKLADPAMIRDVAAGIGPMPLNLVAMPGLPDAAGLRALGVRRLSAGSAPAEAVLGLVGRMAADFLDTGRSEPLFRPENMTWAALNALFP